MTEDEKQEVWIEINRSRWDKTDLELLDLVNKNPFVGTYRFDGSGRLLTSMADFGHIKTVKRLLELGGELEAIEDDEAPLMKAVRMGHLEVANTLLQHGSNSNVGRYLVTASFSSEQMNYEQRIEMVNLLVRYGARINDLYPMFDDKSNLRTVLDFLPESFPMFDFLRSLGAKTAKEVLAENPNAFINES